MSTIKPAHHLSDQDLLNESGRNWNQWFTEMENKNFSELNVLDISAKLVEDYSVDEACARIVALSYCQHIGKCDISDTTSVFEVSVSKTFDYPIEDVFGRASDWFESESRTKLQNVVNKKRLNCKWLSDNSTIDVKFQQKGRSKTKMVVQHDNLDSKTDADIMRNFWKRSIPHMIETL